MHMRVHASGCLAERERHAAGQGAAMQQGGLGAADHGGGSAWIGVESRTQGRLGTACNARLAGAGNAPAACGPSPRGVHARGARASPPQVVLLAVQADAHAPLRVGGASASRCHGGAAVRCDSKGARLPAPGDCSGLTRQQGAPPSAQAPHLALVPVPRHAEGGAGLGARARAAAWRACPAGRGHGARADGDLIGAWCVPGGRGPWVVHREKSGEQDRGGCPLA